MSNIDFHNSTLHRDSVVRIVVYYLLFHFRILVFCGITATKSYGLDFMDFCSLFGKFFLLYVHIYIGLPLPQSRIWVSVAVSISN